MICPECDKPLTVQASDVQTIECQSCWASLDINRIATQPTPLQNPSDNPYYLELTCQRSGKTIEISPFGKTILGRDATGSEILSDFKNSNGKYVISRSHCTIWYSNQCFYIQDNGSTNGTRVGDLLIDCSKQPARIEYNQLIYLGKEPFLASQKPRNASQEEPSLPSCQHGQREETTIVYRCNESGCRFESEKHVDYCPDCASNNIVARPRAKPNGTH